jgi:hypothetical protein
MKSVRLAFDVSLHAALASPTTELSYSANLAICFIFRPLLGSASSAASLPAHRFSWNSRRVPQYTG